MSAAEGAHGGTAALEAVKICKNYEAVVALSEVSITLHRGEIMALMGDNGAGKSTLVKTLAGAVIPDSGEIRLEGERVVFSGPQDPLRLGVETVYQDLALVDSMSARENIFLGREPLKSGWLGRALRVVDKRGAARQAAEVVSNIGARIPSLDTEVVHLSGGQRQALAIARAMLWGRKVVMLDEPTAALGVKESAHVLEVIRTLRDRGVAVLMISHNMAHVFEIADRVTVLRQGAVAGVRDVSATTAEEIVGLITGGTSIPVHH